MSDFTEVLRADSLADGAMTIVELDGHKVLLAHIGDTFYATQEHCPHLGGNLAKGKLDGNVVTCPLHHSQFDLTTGAVIRWTDWTGVVDEVSEVLRHPRSLKTYEVRVEDGAVLIGPERSHAATD
jgi:3-phenylpropionate/trans-cinnamate dioxygenase ferredoxin subunit